MSADRLSIADARARLDAVRADARADAPPEPAHGPAEPPEAQPTPSARGDQKRRKGARRAVPDRFGQFRAAISNTPELSRPLRALLLALIEHTNATTGVTWVSRARLAEELGYRRPGTVSDNLRTLIAGGYVVIEEKEKPGACKSAVKRVTDPNSWPKDTAELHQRVKAARTETRQLPAQPAVPTSATPKTTPKNFRGIAGSPPIDH